MAEQAVYIPPRGRFVDREVELRVAKLEQRSQPLVAQVPSGGSTGGGGSGSGGTVDWSTITGKPTTLAGYGISAVPWSAVTGEPTTLAGYGITDAVPAARTINTSAPLAGGGDLSSDLTLTIATFGAAARGVVPASGGGTTNFLRADGTWTAPPAGGAAPGFLLLAQGIL